ncbi:MAG: ribonuclease J, partial [Myxococcota bacterium]
TLQHPDFGLPTLMLDQLEGVFCTHGHEDHIGALPYLLQHKNVPVYGTPFTLALVEQKCAEHKIKPQLEPVEPGDILDFGKLQVEWCQVPHSIPEACALSLTTPAGRIVHAGDFKLDSSALPLSRQDSLETLEVWGKEGVDVLLLESTNIFQEHLHETEAEVFAALKRFSEHCTERIFLVTFSSQIQRIQQACALAERHRRKVLVLGNSIQRNLEIARQLGLVKVNDSTLVSVQQACDLPLHRLLVLCTGTQGEPFSAIARLSREEQRGLRIGPGDQILWSARAIPGNMYAIAKVQNRLVSLGATLHLSPPETIHASGHATRQELTQLRQWLNPRYLVPIHGEQRFLHAHREMAIAQGFPSDAVLVCRNGTTLQLTQGCLDYASEHHCEPLYRSHPLESALDPSVFSERRKAVRKGVLIMSCVLDTQGRVCAPFSFQSVGFEINSKDAYQRWPTLLHKALATLLPTQRKDLDRVE